MIKNYKPSKLIPLFQVFMSPQVMQPLEKVLFSGYIGQGKKVEEFEKKLSHFLHVKFPITLNSGTSALHLAMRLLNLKKGDEVISTPMTCTATNWPILAQGATIKWADIDPLTGNIDPESIKKKLSSKTKAIVVVNWGGYPCDLDQIRTYCGSIPIIEDAAHAFGSEYKGRMVGESADFTCFSLQAIKHVTAGDGGILITRKKNDYERAKLLRWYGIDRESRSQYDRIEVDIEEWGYKYHMNDINATIGLANLKQICNILKKHRSNAHFYLKHLTNLKHIRLLKNNPAFKSSYWLFTLLVDQKETFIQFMQDKNIMVSQVHRRNDTHPVVKDSRTELPGVDAFTKKMVCIPVGWWVNEKDRSYIVESILEYDQNFPNK